MQLHAKKKDEKKNYNKNKNNNNNKKDVNPHTFAMPVQCSNQLRILGILIIYLHFATALAESLTSMIFFTYIMIFQ